MEIYYNSTDSEYYYTLGRAYADELNKLRYSSNVDFENIVFIGQVADKLFVTDGKNVDVILEMPVEKMPTVSVSELEEICTNLTVDESTDYAVICEPELDNVFTTQNIMPLVSIKDTRSLDVPHVEQREKGREKNLYVRDVVSIPRSPSTLPGIYNRNI